MAGGVVQTPAGGGWRWWEWVRLQTMSPWWTGGVASPSSVAEFVKQTTPPNLNEVLPMSLD